jgi:hypothetical protein
MKEFIKVFIELLILDPIALALRKFRLSRAIDIALRLHNQHNGRRYYVLEVDYKPGYFIVRTREEIKQMQVNGYFRKEAKFVDFLKEAAFVTPAKNIGVEGKNHLKIKASDIGVWVVAVIIVLLFVYGMYVKNS